MKNKMKERESGYSAEKYKENFTLNQQNAKFIFRKDSKLNYE